MNEDRRVRIICGHYGSGKTEIAVNYAVKLAEAGQNPSLADIDVINPYFRSRERALELEQLGIRVIAGSIDASAIDLPAISAGVYSVFDNRNAPAVVDLGGDKGGVTVLKRFSDHFSNPEEYDLFLVVNANRPSTSNAGQVLEYVKQFESGCGLKITGMINNTHMLKSTTADDIIKGYRLSMEAAQIAGIPVRYNAGLRRLEEELPEEIKKDFFPIDLFMRDDWMS